MEPLELALNIVGGQSALAREINKWLEKNRPHAKKIKQQNVWKWLNHSSGIPTAPPAYRLAIERVTDGKVTRDQLSHDIHGGNVGESKVA